MRVIESLPEDALVEGATGEGVSLEEELALEEGFWDFLEVEGETKETEVESDQWEKMGAREDFLEALIESGVP